MTDNVKIEAHVDPFGLDGLTMNPIYYKGIEFSPNHLQTINGELRVLTYKGKYKNLTLEYLVDKSITSGIPAGVRPRPNMLQNSASRGILYITGSLHKLKNRDGNRWNNDDFTLSELIGVVDKLGEELDIDLMVCEIRTFEYAINLQGFGAGNIIESIKKIGMNDFESMKEDRVRYGKKFRFAEYDVKTYHKGEEMRLRGRVSEAPDIYRHEIVVNKMRSAASVKVRTVGDLLNKETFQAMGDFIIKSYNKAYLEASINPDSLSELPESDKRAITAVMLKRAHTGKILIMNLLGISEGAELQSHYRRGGALIKRLSDTPDRQRVVAAFRESIDHMKNN